MRIELLVVLPDLEFFAGPALCLRMASERLQPDHGIGVVWLSGGSPPIADHGHGTRHVDELRLDELRLDQLRLLGAGRCNKERKEEHCSQNRIPAARLT